MIDRSKYGKILNEMKTIAAHYQKGTFDDSIDALFQLQADFDIKLLFVGDFSAGKSSLVNKLVNRPQLLPVAQEAKTDLATELRYSETEYRYAYTLDGKREDISDDHEYTIDKYQHLAYGVNAEGLKALSDYTIVDTPGFNSGLEKHNTALNQYINKGCAYVIVMDQSCGTLKQEMLNHIRDLSLRTNQIAVIINKCDLVTPENASQILENVQGILRSYGLPYKVYLFSRDDSREKLADILSQFNAQAAFDSVMQRHIQSQLQQMLGTLQILRRNYQLPNTYEIDQSIRKYQQLKENMRHDFEAEAQNVREKEAPRMQSIRQKLEKALTDDAGRIAQGLVLGNTGAVEAVIYQTVRNSIMTEIQSYNAADLNDFVSKLNFQGFVSPEESEELNAMAQRAAADVQEMFRQGFFEPKKRENPETATAIFKTITGIGAILTDLINPILEAVIFMLPEILQTAVTLLTPSPEDQARERFINLGIPQILNKVEETVHEPLTQSSEDLLAHLHEELDKNIASIEDNLNTQIAEKETLQNDSEAYRKNLVQDLETLGKLWNQMGGIAQ